MIQLLQSEPLRQILLSLCWIIFEQLQASVKMWMDLGVSNARRYIDNSALSVTLDPTVSRALPAFHADVISTWNFIDKRQEKIS